jgi:AcrR family transcriptional regulator
VLDAAERAIRRDGPGVSLEAIAVEAGVTKPVVYARVGGRTEVSNALSARLADRIIREVGAAIEGKPIGRSTLVSFLTANLEAVAEHRNLFLYVTGGTSDDTPHRALYLASQSTVPLAAQLAAWRTASGLDPAIAEPWSYAIIGMLHLVSLWWLSESDLPAQELAEQLTELLWNGLTTT